LVGVQFPPLVHAVHVPPLHTLLFPHDVPFAAFPAVTQTEVPVEQDVIPVLHMLVGWQLTPAVQLLHVPLLQTLFVPHDVPSATFPVSPQTEVPVVHDVAPVLQRLVGWQAVPVVHAPQVPLSQTLLLPHDIPSATFPVSAQTEVPVTQEVVPVRHALVGWQLTPALQVLHVPPLHTLFVPQVVPLARFCPVSEQAIAGEQTVMPAWQTLDAVQASPAVQATHVPSLQTMLLPQEVPLATFPDCMQTGAPLLQTVVPVRQAAPEIEQLAPAWQLTQVPVAPQTLFVPQLVPAETSFPLSLQTGVPVEQASVPW
jgi:hypothetical protein